MAAEYFNTTLGDWWLEAPASYQDFDVYAWDVAGDMGDLVWIGNLPMVFDEYEDYNIMFVDEDAREIWMEGTLDGELRI